MLFINSSSDNPYFNLASEEYLLKNFTEDIFMLYVNQPSIVVGKHQNALAEINGEFVRKKGIKVARRLSGGGTVYHDKGNLNFCFIQTSDDKSKVNFSKFLEPIIKILNELGVKAKAGEKNDILLDGLKISGNAEHIYKNRILHHGTLLFDSELGVLNQALKVNLERFKDRSVQSRRSTVTNISSNLSEPMEMDDFRETLFRRMIEQQAATNTFTFSNFDLEKINSLVKEKFSTWPWNFGYSPDYEFSKQIEIDSEKVSVLLKVEKGIIKKASLVNSENENNWASNKLNFLVDLKHSYKEIDQKIPNKGIEHISKTELMALLF